MSMLSMSMALVVVLVRALVALMEGNG